MQSAQTRRFNCLRNNVLHHRLPPHHNVPTNAPTLSPKFSRTRDNNANSATHIPAFPGAAMRKALPAASKAAPQTRIAHLAPNATRQQVNAWQWVTPAKIHSRLCARPASKNRAHPISVEREAVTPHAMGPAIARRAIAAQAAAAQNERPSAESISAYRTI